MNNHGMTTRSKSKITDNIKEENKPENKLENNDNGFEEYEELDEHGNLKDFIDYDGDKQDGKAFIELDKLLYNIKPKSRNKKFKKKDKKMNNLFMNYLILKATDKANEQLKNNRKKSRKIKVIEENSSDSELDKEEPTGDLEEDLEEDLTEDSLSENSFTDNSETTVETGDSEIERKLEEEKLDSLEEDYEEDSEEEYSFEYDKYDEELEEVIDNHAALNSEEHTMEYFHNLEEEKKKELIQHTKDIYKINDSQVPLRFKIINSDMDIKTKAVAIENIDKLSEMDVSTGEHSKMDHWINGLIKIPFGKYQNLPVTPDSSLEDKKSFIKDTYKTLNKAIYGHNEAKTHILQVIGKWIKNPDSGGNVLAIQGPMGNGKTTLVKEGISKVLNRPFAFIALGGASDSAYFDGHCYTYEGSHWGRIVQILQDSKCMNPVFYFDELDKISDTQKGDEIIHMLTHLTDSSQNSLFQDNYFPGVNLDLSKALFIFSYNDESKVNKILKDRMYVIHTKGFKTEEKLKICREYLLPDILNTFAFEDNEIIFTDEILKEIIEKYTLGEEGVRNLKRCIETIISKVNIYILSEGDNELSFKIKNFKLPFEIKLENISDLLKIGEKDKPPEHMYM